MPSPFDAAIDHRLLVTAQRCYASAGRGAMVQTYLHAGHMFYPTREVRRLLGHPLTAAALPDALRALDAYQPEHECVVIDVAREPASEPPITVTIRIVCEEPLLH